MSEEEPTSDTSGASGTGASGTGASGAQPDASQPPPAPGGGPSAVFAHMMSNKVEAGLWCTRLFTVFSTIFFILPIFGGNTFSLYQRALLSNAATSALRLHQRLPHFQFSREFFGLVFLEDSAHYLFFSLIFVTTYPVTMALIPVFLFALLHSSNYTKALLNILGPNSLMFMRNLIAKLTEQQRNILRFIACCEIFLMPAIIMMMFSGHGNLLLPFVYYRFLTLRYTSRRNPYCKQLFYELHVTTLQLAGHQRCPAFVGNVVRKAISLILRIAPADMPAQPQAPAQ